MDKRTLYIHNKESKRPFNIYDVSDFERVYIDGNLFPIEINNEKLTVKGNRSPKPFKQHDEMIQRFIDAGITFEKEGEVDVNAKLESTIGGADIFLDLNTVDYFCCNLLNIFVYF